MSEFEVDAGILQAGQDGDVVYVKVLPRYASNRATFDQWENMQFEYRKRNTQSVYMVIVRRAVNKGVYVNTVVEPVDCECGSRQGARKICKHLRLVAALVAGDIKYRVVMQPIFRGNGFDTEQEPARRGDTADPLSRDV